MQRAVPVHILTSLQALLEHADQTVQICYSVFNVQGLVSERDKAFRAQAFALKQANTRISQLQQQQAESSSREAALVEELSFGAIQGQPSAADTLLSADGRSTSGLRKMQSRLPSGMETMRRRLEPILSTGQPCCFDGSPLALHLNLYLQQAHAKVGGTTIPFQHKIISIAAMCQHCSLPHCPRSLSSTTTRA